MRLFPLALWPLPQFQGRGIGRALIETTTKRAKKLGYNAILIYGDPQYYSRFGFVAAKTFQIATRENLYLPALQALELTPKALANKAGRFFEDDIYILDTQAAQDFDRGFPPKERQSGLKSQLRFEILLKQGVPRKK